MDNLIRDLKTQIEELNQKVYSQEQKLLMNIEKEKCIKNSLLIHTIIGTTGYFFGSFVHPIIGLASIIYYCLSIIPSGFILIDKQDKIEKFQESIKENKQKINNTQARLDKILNEEIISTKTKNR